MPAPPNPHSITEYIDGNLSGSHSLFKFPEDTPKYHTTITFETFSGGQGAGGYRSADPAAAAQKIADWFAKGTGMQEGALKSETLAGWSTKLTDLWKKSPNLGAAQETNETIILPYPVNLLDVHKVQWDEKSIIELLTLGFSGATRNTATLGGAFVGLAPNWLQTIIFDRPEYKRLELAFKLSPRNYIESAAIREIIMTLNNAMSPGLTAGNFLFQFPNIVRVTLKPNNSWIFKLKPAVIESMGVNYAGGDGKKAFYHSHDSENNPPESVELTLHLCETEYWIKGQFNRLNEDNKTGAQYLQPQQ